jgi:16S rRNA A1518/A1519 N6-dimethyltransferase RsmA/KsgA/DIM1 with predicted DNA glycosylase/AP lyase activity
MPSTSRSACRFCAPASITARRSPWRAPARRMPAACAPRWRWRSSWRGERRQWFVSASGSTSCTTRGHPPHRRCGRAQPGERIVEIGPGRGALTWALLERAKRLDVIEIDRDLAQLLRADPARQGRPRVHPWDVLDMDFEKLRGAGPKLRVVGNLPYNISTPAAVSPAEQRERDRRHALHAAEGGRGSHGGRAGGKEYGRLTVMLAVYAEVERLFDVGPGAFQPPPKVWSAIVRLRPAPTAIRHRQRCGAADGRQRRLLAPAQDPAQRPEGPARRAGHRSLRHRSGAAPPDARRPPSSACSRRATVGTPAPPDTKP